MKIVITGYPNSGKSTLANILVLATGSFNLLQTDKLLETHDWSDLSAAVSEWFDKPGNWIIEGVAAPRAIRKWRAKHPNAKPPFDMFIYMRRGFETYRPGQRAMANGMDTVMLELWNWIKDSDSIVVQMGPRDDDTA
jgi:dephospho-CoA kinase